MMSLVVAFVFTAETSNGDAEFLAFDLNENTDPSFLRISTSSLFASCKIFAKFWRASEYVNTFILMLIQYFDIQIGRHSLHSVIGGNERIG